MSAEQTVEETIQEMKDEGLIEWTGEYRNGQKTFVITPKGVLALAILKGRSSDE